MMKDDRASRFRFRLRLRMILLVVAFLDSLDIKPLATRWPEFGAGRKAGARMAAFTCQEDNLAPGGSPPCRPGAR